MSEKRIDPAVARELAELFHRNGYVRRHDPERRRKEKGEYHRGDEVRLVANSVEELAHIRRLLKRAGFKPGRPFPKKVQFRQPVYGRAATERFLTMVSGAR